MSKLKKVLLMCTAYVLVAALAIGGTIAYLQDEDSDVNVMTLGNVSIEQIEQERDADGNLVDFTQAKPLYPAVYSNGSLAFDDDGLYVNGEYHQVCDASVKNVLDKIVTVKNTGKTDAYMRTVIALECPEGFDGNLINLNVNTSAYKVGDHCYIEVDGNRYEVYTLTHKEILEAGVVSEPSLLQVWLNPTATNEDVEVLDGNDNGTYDILVLSQAVQAAGFADAKTALDTAFGKTSEKAAEWFGGEEFDIPTAVSTADELNAALAAGADVVLAADIELADTVAISADATLDLNGFMLTSNSVAPITINGGTLTLKDSGTDGAVVAGSTSSNNDDKAAILFGTNGGKFVMESGTLKSTKYAVRSNKISSSEIVINGGKIEAESYGVYDNAGSVTMNGGEIVSNFYGIAAYGHFTMNGGKITAQCAYLSNGTYDDSVAVINGGELIGTVYNCIYWPSAGSLTINGGSITGVNGIYVRSGSLSITGGTITGTGDNETALTVENIGGDSGYQEIANVSIAGGTFISKNGLAVTSVSDTTGSNPSAVEVTGFITGGTYNSDVSTLVAEGYAATENDGIWTVAAN